MRYRQGITELFSTFLQLAEDCFSGWVTDQRLRRSIENCLKQLPESRNSENYWVLYWYKLWQTKPDVLARGHLLAYLQEVCYWAAHKTAINLVNSQYKLSDCFQVAIAQVDKVLKGFNPDYSSNLKSYASTTFKSILTHTLRQQQEKDLCTDWALLRKLSQKRLEKSLESVGLTSEEIQQHRLAWICFKTLYAPTPTSGTQQLSRPDNPTWEAIAQLYNRERLSQLNLPGSECIPQTLEQWLRKCAKSARSYLYPQAASLNAPQTGQDSGELLEDLASVDKSLLDEIIAQEESQNRQTQQTQIGAILAATLLQLDPELQKILQLYYHQGLTQQQIAQQLEIKQYTVSRRLTKGRELLLKALAQWSQKTFHIFLNSNAIAPMGEFLEEWLQGYYESIQLYSLAVEK